MSKNPAFVLGIIFLTAALVSCKHEIPKVPGTGPDGKVCFETDVLPIFQSYCAKAGCHDVDYASDNYILDTYAHIVSRGIRPGNAEDSKLYEVLLASGDDRMPQAPNDPLSAAQIATIRQWINEGALNSTGCAPTCDSSSFTYSNNVRPILQTYCLGCHSGLAADGGYVPLDTYDGVLETVNSQLLLRAVDQTGPFPMPKGGAKMSDCKIAVIRKWIEAGAPNN